MAELQRGSWGGWVLSRLARSGKKGIGAIQLLKSLSFAHLKGCWINFSALVSSSFRHCLFANCNFFRFVSFQSNRQKNHFQNVWTERTNVPRTSLLPHSKRNLQHLKFLTRCVVGWLATWSLFTVIRDFCILMSGQACAIPVMRRRPIWGLHNQEKAFRGGRAWISIASCPNSAHHAISMPKKSMPIQYQSMPIAEQRLPGAAHPGPEENMGIFTLSVGGPIPLA